MEEKILLGIGLIGICVILYAYDNYRIRKKYSDLKEEHERLKTEVRLLQQENYYLKMMTGTDRV